MWLGKFKVMLYSVGALSMTLAGVLNKKWSLLCLRGTLYQAWCSAGSSKLRHSLCPIPAEGHCFVWIS